MATELIRITESICSVCREPVTAEILDHQDQIWIKKHCDQHGEQWALVEPNREFYYRMQQSQGPWEVYNQLLIEITDRCQLSCKDCYHLADSRLQDHPQDKILAASAQISQHQPLVLAGAEPTLYRDLPGLVRAIRKQRPQGDLTVLTNGLRLRDPDYVKKLTAAGLDSWFLGLNHHSYQGLRVHQQQLQALKTVIDQGWQTGYVGYTMNGLETLPEILEEIDQISDPSILQFRLRRGSNIGRTGEQTQPYISELVEAVEQQLAGEVQWIPADNNPYHIMMLWRGRQLRLIQWPDHTNIDMGELKTGPWCDFVPGRAATNFVHQVIMRDWCVNNRQAVQGWASEQYWMRENVSMDLSVLA